MIELENERDTTIIFCVCVVCVYSALYVRVACLWSFESIVDVINI